MYQLVYPTLLQPIAFRLWQIYLPKIVRQCGKLSSSLPGIAAHLWWAMMIGWVIWVDISGQSDILVLADVPHPLPNYNCTKHESYRTKSFQERSSSTFYNLPAPLPVPLSDSMPEQETGEFQFQMDMDIWTWTPSATPHQPTKEWNAHFWIMFNFWWWTRLVDGLKPCLPPLSSQKNEMLIFELHSTSDDGLGCLMDSNPIHHPSPARKMKCSFLDDYVQLLMIGWAAWWTRTPSITPLQPKKWNAHFWIMFNFWWSARLVDGLEPHPPSRSSQKNEMLIFQLCSTSDDGPSWSMDWNPVCHPSPARKMKCSFLDYVQLLMMGWAGRWTRIPSTTTLQAENEMLIFGLCSTSDDRPGWLMDSNPIHHPSPANKMKCSFWDYVQLLMMGWAGQWTQTPSTTPLQPEKWNAHF